MLSSATPETPLIRSAAVADCYCGCGLKVRFGRRGMNKNIRRTDDLLAKLKQAQQDALGFKPFPDSNPEGMKEMVDDPVRKGADHRQFWIQATHGDHPQVASEALEAKRGWNQWFVLLPRRLATP